MTLDEFVQYMDPNTFSVVFRDYPIFVAGALFGCVVTYLIAYFWSIKPHISDKRLLASKLHELELDIQERDEEQLSVQEQNTELAALYDDQCARNNHLSKQNRELIDELLLFKSAQVMHETS